MTALAGLMLAATLTTPCQVSDPPEEELGSVRCNERTLTRALRIVTERYLPRAQSNWNYGSTLTYSLQEPVSLSQEKRNEAASVLSMAESKARALRDEAADLDFVESVLSACGVKQ